MACLHRHRRADRDERPAAEFRGRGTRHITDISGVTPVLHATQVLAGNSQEGPLVDHVTGTVSARSGNTVTLHNAFEVLRASAFQSYGLPLLYFYNDATVDPGIHDDHDDRRQRCHRHDQCRSRWASRSRP